MSDKGYSADKIEQFDRIMSRHTQYADVDSSLQDFVNENPEMVMDIVSFEMKAAQLRRDDDKKQSDKEIEESGEDDDTDPFLEDAIKTVVEVGQASTSFIQRRFKVGYARAGRIIDQMEARGIISGYEGSKPRQVLITKERLEELKMAKPVEQVKQ